MDLDPFCVRWRLWCRNVGQRRAKSGKVGQPRAKSGKVGQPRAISGNLGRKMVMDIEINQNSLDQSQATRFCPVCSGWTLLDSDSAGSALFSHVWPVSVLLSRVRPCWIRLGLVQHCWPRFSPIRPCWTRLGPVRHCSAPDRLCSARFAPETAFGPFKTMNNSLKP